MIERDNLFFKEQVTEELQYIAEKVLKAGKRITDEEGLIVFEKGITFIFRITGEPCKRKNCMEIKLISIEIFILSLPMFVYS